MTPGARLQAAVELSAEVAAAARPADAVLERYFRTRRFAGAKDRRAITERVYALIRHRARLDWWIGRAAGDHPPADPARARLIADLALADAASADAVDTLFSGLRHCPPALDADERRVAAGLADQPLDHPEMPAWVRAECPEWLFAELERLWGAAAADELAALNRPAPVDLRVNTLKADRARASAALADDGIEAAPTAISPVGLRIAGRRARIGGTRAFRDGLVEVQDEGSQIVALLAGARPGMTLVDFCAGAGGKTLALAAGLGRGDGDGEVIACDVSSRRMQRMDVRLHRAGTGLVRRRLLRSEHDPWIGENAGRADRVLADAPCSGTGVWRRHPEAKWRLSGADVKALVDRQRRILAGAARLVKPGGRLVYATCSVLPDENERQVEWLLARRPELSPLPIGEVWAETIGGPCPGGGTSLRLTPATTGTDGFFVAVLKRQA